MVISFLYIIKALTLTPELTICKVISRHNNTKLQLFPSIRLIYNILGLLITIIVIELETHIYHGVDLDICRYSFDSSFLGIDLFQLRLEFVPDINIM